MFGHSWPSRGGYLAFEAREHAQRFPDHPAHAEYWEAVARSLQAERPLPWVSRADRDTASEAAPTPEMAEACRRGARIGRRPRRSVLVARMGACVPGLVALPGRAVSGGLEGCKSQVPCVSRVPTNQASLPSP